MKMGTASGQSENNCPVQCKLLLGKQHFIIARKCSRRGYIVNEDSDLRLHLNKAKQKNVPVFNKTSPVIIAIINERSAVNGED